MCMCVSFIPMHLHSFTHYSLQCRHQPDSELKEENDNQHQKVNNLGHAVGHADEIEGEHYSNRHGRYQQVPDLYVCLDEKSQGCTKQAPEENIDFALYLNGLFEDIGAVTEKNDQDQNAKNGQAAKNQPVGSRNEVQESKTGWQSFLPEGRELANPEVIGRKEQVGSNQAG